MGSRTERWTCPACGIQAEGTGPEGLWPPHGWQTSDGGQLLALCPAHISENAEVSLPDGSQFRGFPGPG
jgi:hypothetical protein